MYGEVLKWKFDPRRNREKQIRLWVTMQLKQIYLYIANLKIHNQTRLNTNAPFTNL